MNRSHAAVLGCVVQSLLARGALASVRGRGGIFLRIAVVLSLLAAAVAPSPAVAQQSFATSFPARILAAHNAARARAGVPSLVWDNALGTAAAGYATQMAM